MNSKAHFWSALPFIRALIPFCLGIVSYGHLVPALLLCLLLVAISTAIIFPFLAASKRFQFQYIPGLQMLLLVFLTGNMLTHWHDTRNDPIWFASQGFHNFTCSVSSPPVKGAYYTRFTVRVTGVSTSSGHRVASGYILIKTKLPEHGFREGDLLLVNKRPDLLPDTAGGTNGYLAYLHRKNILHQVILNQADFRILRRYSNPDLVKRLRNGILARINRHVKGKNENALAKALLVGERAELDESLSQAYADTGVIHIIAISGMHLALIYSLIAFALRPMERLKRLRWLKTILIIISLWIFSFICGASPSVLRSAVMFTFLLAGQRLEKDNNPVNILGASAFLLLSINPMLLYDIGFQLSYAAVGSLLVFNKKVSSIFVPENKLLEMAWNTISTSISAQILTTPLVIFHFHQFPLLFILSNLVAVPLSGIILIILIAICMLDPVTIVSTFMGKAAAFLIRMMNERIISLGSVSFGKWENINLNWYEVVNIYLLILLLSLWMRSKK